MHKTAPVAVVVDVDVDECYIHCAKALRAAQIPLSHRDAGGTALGVAVR